MGQDKGSERNNREISPEAKFPDISEDQRIADTFY